MLSNKSNVKPKPKVAREFRFEAIGTAWQITFASVIADSLAEELLRSIQERIEEFDRNYSRFRADSLISTIAKEAGRYHLPDDAEPLFKLYKQMYDLSGGLMTPLIGQVLSDAGYDAQYSLRSGPLQKTPAWLKVLDYQYPNLVVKRPVLLDLGAIGKGYLVDIVAQLIDEAGVTDFCVNAGGDMLQRQTTEQPMRVGLEHPDHSDEVVGIVNLKNQSLCGSAGNRRVWGDFNHIINPETQTSPTHLKAVWVLADTTILADALSTALFFTPASKLDAAFTFEYAMVRGDYSLEHSANFPAEYFTREQETRL
jgi:thiamine biosynthesis lipoprotein